MNGDAMMDEDGSAGWGTVVRGSEGIPLAVAHGASHHRDIIIIELQAMEEGLRLAIDKGYKQLLLQSDSSNAVRCAWYSISLEGAHNGETDQKLIAQLQAFEVICVYRETNRLADRIAALHPGERLGEIHLENLPQCLLSIVHDDASGKQYSQCNRPYGVF